MVSNVNNKSIFDFDERLKFIGIDFNSKEKNIFQIAKKVKVASRNIDFNGIYDLHDVIRSKILCLLLSSKTDVSRVFEKQRILKNKILSKKIKLQKLKTSSERYLYCLKKDFDKLDFSNISKSLRAGATKKNIIGIAPFSAHKSKIWPLSNYQKIKMQMIKYACLHLCKLTIIYFFKWGRSSSITHLNFRHSSNLE